MTLSADGRVAIRSRFCPLEAAIEAMTDLEQGALHGRGILVPAA